MIVMKFGGMTLENASSISRVIDIIKGRVQTQFVLVFSAMGKTTRRLLKIGELAAQGSGSLAGKELEDLVTYHEDIIRALLPDRSAVFSDGWDGFVKGINSCKDRIERDGNLTPAIKDEWLAYGELLSTFILTEVLRKSMNAVWLDARKLIVTDQKFNRAYPLEEPTVERLRRVILPILESGGIPVIQGYIGATEQGQTTTLGFEGSDFTATLVGYALDADEITIWKEVPGLMSADPAMIKNGITISTVTYEEATELAFFGAQVLHPNAMDPAKKKDIPIRILCTHHPEEKGTRIGKPDISSKRPVTSITYGAGVTLIRSEPAEERCSFAFLKEVFDVLDRFGVMPRALSNDGKGITLALMDSDIKPEMEISLKNLGYMLSSDGMATISLVGEKIRNIKTLSETVRRLTGTVRMVSDINSPVTYTFVIGKSELKSTLEKLHRHFFES